jgi:hypothetical protein
VISLLTICVVATALLHCTALHCTARLACRRIDHIYATRLLARRWPETVERREKTWGACSGGQRETASPSENCWRTPSCHVTSHSCVAMGESNLQLATCRISRSHTPDDVFKSAVLTHQTIVAFMYSTSLFLIVRRVAIALRLQYHQHTMYYCPAQCSANGVNHRAHARACTVARHAPDSSIHLPLLMVMVVRHAAACCTLQISPGPLPAGHPTATGVGGLPLARWTHHTRRENEPVSSGATRHAIFCGYRLALCAQ